jgi:hypothetical protein
MNMAYGRYGQVDPVSAVAMSIGMTAQTIGMGLQMQPRGSAIEERAAYREAGAARARRRQSMLQTQMIRQLVTIGALAIGGGIALVAILGAAKAGEKKK